MSPTASRKAKPTTKRAAKSASTKSAARKSPTKKSAAKKLPANRPPAKKSQATKPATKKTAAKKAAATKKPAARKPVAKRGSGSVAGSKPASKTARAAKTSTTKTMHREASSSSGSKRTSSSAGSAANRAVGSASRRQTAGSKPVSPSPVSRPSATGDAQDVQRAAARAKPARAPRKRATSAALAKRHFLEALEAKQERVRQGPSYPPANAFTGRSDDDAVHAPVISESGVAPVEQPAPSPEATYVTNLLRARGNQGMRKQR